MIDRTFSVRFWGARGSLPVAGPDFTRYGGNTACIEVQCGPHTLVFDAGSGIKAAGLAIRAAGVRDLHLFLTHCHYDHIMGLPFFAPLYDPRIRLETWSGHLAGSMSTKDILRGFMRPPFFPVEISVCKADLISRDFRSGEAIRPWPDVTVRTGSLNHPGGCIGYRVEFGGRAIAFVTDTEHIEGELDPVVMGLIEDAELVIYDCSYTDEEMVKYRGWGHSTWQQGVRLCEAAGAQRLAIFHHDPFRTDTDLAAIEAKAQAVFPGAFVAHEGLTVDIAMRRKKRRAMA